MKKVFTVVEGMLGVPAEATKLDILNLFDKQLQTLGYELIYKQTGDELFWKINKSTAEPKKEATVHKSGAIIRRVEL